MLCSTSSAWVSAVGNAFGLLPLITLRHDSLTPFIVPQCSERISPATRSDNLFEMVRMRTDVPAPLEKFGLIKPFNTEYLYRLATTSLEDVMDKDFFLSVTSAPMPGPLLPAMEVNRVFQIAAVIWRKEYPLLADTLLTLNACYDQFGIDTAYGKLALMLFYKELAIFREQLSPVQFTPSPVNGNGKKRALGDGDDQAVTKCPRRSSMNSTGQLPFETSALPAACRGKRARDANGETFDDRPRKKTTSSSASMAQALSADEFQKELVKKAANRRLLTQRLDLVQLPNLTRRDKRYVDRLKREAFHTLNVVLSSKMLNYSVHVPGLGGTRATAEQIQGRLEKQSQMSEEQYIKDLTKDAIGFWKKAMSSPLFSVEATHTEK